MLHHVNINTGAQRLVKALVTGAINYLFDGEVGSLGLFAVQKCSSNPDFIGDFSLGKDLFCHKNLLAM
jgi:lysozyme family protein